MEKVEFDLSVSSRKIFKITCREKETPYFKLKSYKLVAIRAYKIKKVLEFVNIYPCSL